MRDECSQTVVVQGALETRVPSETAEDQAGNAACLLPGSDCGDVVFIPSLMSDPSVAVHLLAAIVGPYGARTRRKCTELSEQPSTATAGVCDTVKRVRIRSQGNSLAGADEVVVKMRRRKTACNTWRCAATTEEHPVMLKFLWSEAVHVFVPIAQSCARWAWKIPVSVDDVVLEQWATLPSKNMHCK